jgi:hypothetical protein
MLQARVFFPLEFNASKPMLYRTKLINSGIVSS